MDFYGFFGGSGGGGGGGVTTLNGLSGAVILAAGAGITLTPAGNTITIAATGTALALGAFDGQAATANGLALVANVLYAQSADATHPGMVNTGVQTFAGAKTFTGAISASNLSGTNTGNVTLTAVGVAPNANGASLAGQALTLQLFDATNPGLVPLSGGGTTNFLRADGTFAPATATPAWLLVGNAGTTAGTNFVGTTDAIDLVFKTNSAESMRIVESTGGVTINQAVTNTGALNIKSKGAGLAQCLVLESPSSTDILEMEIRDGGDMFFCRPSQSTYPLVSSGAFTGTGPASPLCQWDVVNGIAGTTLSTIQKQAAAQITNNDMTDGNFSALNFQGGNVVDLRILAVHDLHAAGGSGHFEFWGNNAGTQAKRMGIAIDGTVDMPKYGAGLATFNGSGVISSVAAGNLTDVGTDGITITGGSGALVSSASISQQVADATHNGYLSSADWSTFNGKGSGSVTSVALSVPASSLFSVAGSPVTSSGTLAISTAGTSGGIPYFDTASTMNTSAALSAHAVVLGGGAGAAPYVVTGLGTSGQVLTSNGAAADPTWQNAGGASSTTSTQWTSFSPTLSASFGTATNVAAFWRRVGDTMDIKIAFTAGTTTAALATITIPTALSMDTAKMLIAASNTQESEVVGTWQTGNANQDGVMLASTTSSTTLIYLGREFVAGSRFVPINANSTLADNTLTQFFISVPISGWTNNN